MRLQPSAPADISSIVQIIEAAKAHLAFLKIDQWQNGYPNKEQIENDVTNNESYVVLNDEQTIIATAMFLFIQNLLIK